MSVHVLSWAWQQTLPDPSTKLVLLKLADSANDDGVCWPSQTRVGAECGLSDRSVRYKIEKLVELGLIVVRPRREGQRRTSNVYTVLYRQPASVRDDSLPASCDTVNRQPASAEPSLEPSGPSLRSGAPADPIWDTLVELLGDAPRTRSERSKWNKAAKELREADVTPEEIRTAVAAYGRHPTFKECALTPLAIVTNLSTLLAWAKPAQASRAEDIRQRMARRGIE